MSDVTEYPHLMIDLETHALTADSVILSIGAVKFNERTICDQAFYRNISIESQPDRYSDPETVAWWKTQPEEARATLAQDQCSIADAVLALSNFYTREEWENTKVWSNGASFDIPILNHAFAKLGMMPVPWRFWNESCYRTMKNRPWAKDIPFMIPEIRHHALYDAIAQATHLQTIWARERGMMTLVSQLSHMHATALEPAGEEKLGRLMKNPGRIELIEGDPDEKVVATFKPDGETA